MKQSFPNNPKLEFLPDGRSAKLLEPFSYVDTGGRVHTATAGMITDGGSVPRFFWRLIGSPFTRCLPAYIIHDWYCERAADLAGQAANDLRRQADRLFAEMLAYLGVSRLKRAMMYAGVRLGAIS